jgi:DNA-binding beta-propeller fold protein YncE
MANDKSFKIKNGLLAGRYLQSNGVETEGSVGYDIAGASYDSKSFDVNSQLGDIYGGAFKSDGTKFYAVNTSTPFMVAYDLSTAWDISTASYNTETFNPTSQDTIPYGVDFKPDGTKMYVVFNGNDTVYQYSLSTAWDISTASYDTGKTVSVTSQTTFPVGIKFKPDGTKMYVNTIGIIYQYALSTAWDVSTASYESKSFDHTSESNGNYQLDFNSDGNKFWVANGSSDAIYQYSLSTAYDISTASYDNVSFSTINEGTNVRCVILKTDGTKMYTIDGASDQVLQYSTASYTQTLDLSTGNTFSFTPSGATTVSFTNPPASDTAVGFAVEIVGDGSAITWPSSVKWPSGTAPTATASKELYTFITTDGGTTYYGKKAAGDIA